METWVGFFVILAAVAIILQMAILGAMYLTMRRTSENMTRMAADFHAKSEPVLTRLRILLDDAQPRVSSIAADAAEIAHVARGQVYQVDRVLAETLDRLRLQIIRADQMLTGALEHIETAGSEVKRSVMGPVQQAAAIIQGVKAGLEVFRGHRRSPERARGHQDEELFI